jgi:hypothetical protein
MNWLKVLTETHCRVLGITQRNDRVWTLNQRVAGSSPARLTIILNDSNELFWSRPTNPHLFLIRGRLLERGSIQLKGNKHQLGLARTLKHHRAFHVRRFKAPRRPVVANFPLRTAIRVRFQIAPPCARIEGESSFARATWQRALAEFEEYLRLEPNGPRATTVRELIKRIRADSR